MFEIVQTGKRSRAIPMAAGLGVVSAVLCLRCLLSALAAPDFRVPPAQSSLRVTTLAPMSRPGGVRGRPSRSAAAKGRRPAAAPPASAARPGTPDWFSHVRRGRELAFEIYAEQSLPVLRAYGVTLAMDIGRPRGFTYLFDLASRSFSRGPAPGNVVVRELVDLPPVRDIDEARAVAERELGAKVRVFALYPIDLYQALRSYTEQVLRQAAVPLESVAVARVRLRLVSGRAFVVSLVSHS